MNDSATVDPTSQRFEFQKTLFEKGFSQVQNQIIHLDEIHFKIKASAITIWVALMGWAFASSTLLLVPLGIVVIVGFWLLEAMFKGVQAKYIEISAKLMHAANDTDSLQNQFELRHFETEIIYPLALKLTEIDRLVLMLRGMVSPTIATVYLFLAFVNVLLWMVVG